MAQTDWKRNVVYQIYPRSFCDTNGDGVGDLPGITRHLDYLKQLGVDVVWLSPVYRSPQDDNGYDISDYRAIAPEFGTMAEFDEMLAQMHARGIRLVMDLVVNHTSDEHEWFRQARSSRDNPWHDFYIWAEPAPDGGPPTNWEAAFTGSIWEWNEPTGEYYLHMFSRRQPDLNWENPRVRAEVYAMMKFWLDKGVDGFRMDVINMISKPWQSDGTLPNAPVVRPGFLQPGFALTCNGPRLAEFLREMRREVLDHYDTLTVGEAPMATVLQGQELTHPDTGALNMLFQFEHMDLDSVPGHPAGKWAVRPLPLAALRQTMTRWQEGLYGRGWNSLYLSNHDQPRPVSRFGDDDEYRVLSAKMLAIFLHLHQGTPYVYQGEELGMTNVPFETIDAYRDIESINYFRVATVERGENPEDVLKSIRFKSRDNARTPMQWNDGPGAGFTSGTPWIALNPNHDHIHAEQAVADAGSIFHTYRRLIALRHQEDVITSGRFRPILEESPQVYAFLREGGQQTLLVLCHFGSGTEVVTLPAEVAGPGGERIAAGEVLIGNYDSLLQREGAAVALRPWEAQVIRLR